jgi:hypothetical protein
LIPSQWAFPSKIASRAETVMVNDHTEEKSEEVKQFKELAVTMLQEMCTILNKQKNCVYHAIL